MDTETRDLLTLHLVPGLGPRLIAALLERFGSPTNVLRATADRLAEVPHLGTKLAHQLRDAFARGDVETELRLMQEHRVSLVRLGTPDYPAALATVAVPPHLLYVRGALEGRDGNAVAVVGSRHCTSYGRKIAERLAMDLVQASFCVVSGLARGIDACAHRGALQGGGRTIAVLAGGLSKIYPPEHAELAEQIASSGALISESSMRMEPMAGMFPARNRIISGLSRAVVIVEAAEKSGALITARHAAEQGREVFVVPGPVDSPSSAGTLMLLRQGAKLVRNSKDVIEDLNGIAPIVVTQDTAPAPPQLDEKQSRVWETLSSRPRHIDEIARETQLSIAELAGLLLVLEMKRIVRRLPGNQYERQ